MSRKLFYLFGFILVSAVLAYLVFFGYMFAVAQKQAEINGGDPQEIFTNLVEQEKQSLFDTGQFFWPSWPTTPIEVAVVPTSTPAPSHTPAPTQTPQTMLPTTTSTPTRLPTAIPTKEPTPIPNPEGEDWHQVYDFSGGPEVLIDSDCVLTSLTECSDQNVRFYLAGYQENEVYLNGFDTGRGVQIWTIRLIPGFNTLTIPPADRVAVGNTTDIEVLVHQSNGFYRDCEPDINNPLECNCTDYAEEITVYQPAYGYNDSDQYLTTIWFISAYSEVMYLNDFQSQISIPIESGTVLLLPFDNWLQWDITTTPIFPIP